MERFVLDCDPVSQVSDSLTTIAGEVSRIHSTLNGFDTSCEDFDFSSAKAAIASNLDACVTKVQNTSKVIEKVVSTHTSLQNRLIGKDTEEETEEEDAVSGSKSGSAARASSLLAGVAASSTGYYGTSTRSHHAGASNTVGWGGDKYTYKGPGEVVALPNDGAMKVNFTDDAGNSLITVKLEDGKDVFYDAQTGDKIEDLGAEGALFSDDVAYLEEMRNKARTNGSDTDWYCIVDRDNFRTTVLKNLDGDWRVIKTYDCGTGAWGIEGMNESHTFTGMWKVDHKSAYDGPNDWWTCFIPYYKPDGTDFGQGFHAGYTGTPEYQSYGCTRLDTYNAKWIFDNVPVGTTVEVF